MTPERLDATFAALADPTRRAILARLASGEAIVTNSLVEESGKTTLTLSVMYESKEARDIALQSPMEQGVAMGFDRLAEIVEKP